MSEQPKRVSRRDFLRLAGLGAGASLAAPKLSGTRSSDGEPAKGFADSAGRPARPWWVKTVDDPTVEIDWDQVQRFDEQQGTVRGPGLAKYVGQAEVDRIDAISGKRTVERILADEPGYTLKDYALDAGQDARPSMSFLGPQNALTPGERGVPKWEGSPEAAARIIRVAMRHFGAADVAFLELDDNTRKLIYSHDPDGKQLIFTDDPVASETDEARYIPNLAKYVIVYTVQMSAEAMKRAPTMLASQTSSGAYLRGRQIQMSTQEFLRVLGYQGLGESSTNALGIAPALGVMAGLGELSRLNRLITPEHGPMVRVFKMLTDLPVATDKPIDAGIMKFCKTCKKCAEACEPAALSFEDEPTWEVRGGWNNPGHKAYFEDATRCMTFWRESVQSTCGICFAVCPFAKEDKAWIHDWVKAGIASVPALDSFVRTMDDALGYGAQREVDAWWHLDLPELGIDTTSSVKRA
ncbi:MAG: reductive dehalogenase [Anaerolineales bacterium]